MIRWKSGRELHKGLNKGTIGLECLLGTRRARRGGSSTFSYNSLKRWGSVRIRYVSVKVQPGSSITSPISIWATSFSYIQKLLTHQTLRSVT